MGRMVTIDNEDGQQGQREILNERRLEEKRGTLYLPHEKAWVWAPSIFIIA